MRHKHYDKDGDIVKANAVVWMAGTRGDTLGTGEMGYALRRHRQEREEKYQKEAQDQARITLREAAASPQNNRSKQWNLIADERSFFQRVLKDLNNREMAAATTPPNIFPSDGRTRRWTKLFYRLLDSLQGPDGDQMRAIEMDLFHAKFKPEGWTGTREQNREADKKIAAAIRSSLQQYERNKKAVGYNGQVFKFSRT